MKKLMLLITLLSCTWALAQEHETPKAAETTTSHEAAHHEAVDNQPHPTLSHDSSWAGAMVIIVLGMFLLAAAVGVAVRANTPEAPPADAHHDDHGHGGHDDHAHGGGHGHGH